MKLKSIGRIGEVPTYALYHDDVGLLAIFFDQNFGHLVMDLLAKDAIETAKPENRGEDK